VWIEVDLMDAAGLSHIGLVRKKNEDNFILDREHNLFVICDGMGGHKGGDTASRIATEIIGSAFSRGDEQDKIAALNNAIIKANDSIWQAGLEEIEFHEMGTTVTAAFIENDSLTIANVGDSSLYLLRENQIKKITRDHTLAQQMVIDGLLKESEVRTCSYNHVLTRALGVQEEVHIDNFTIEIKPRDYIVLCSDGLSDMLEDIEILSIINHYRSDANAEQLAEKLVNAALDKGGYDNITVIVLCI
jgi:protein phosphatase